MEDDIKKDEKKTTSKINKNEDDLKKEWRQPQKK
jgi:hypothetical protein